MTKDVLIIGSSPAGLQATMDLADAGLEVHLVDPEPFLGTDGSLNLPRHLANTRLLEIARHPHVRLWTSTHVNNMEGKAGKFHVELRRHPRYVDLDRCTACGKCVEVCPVTVPGTDHKVIYLDGQPGCMAIDKLGKPPCANTCPGGIHVQGYVALIAQGRFQEAIDLVREAIPFPGICGRVCTHPCEFNCRRAEIDKPVAVRLLKRFVSDWELTQKKSRRKPKIETPALDAPKVAVIGAGPGGMAVAERLARLGYRVTVFEKLPVIGGMMAVGIPEYRLPRDVIAREYKHIKDLGVELRLNTAIGPNGKYTLDDLFGNGYRAVCLAVGAHRSQELRIPGEGLSGVVHGTDLLMAINLSRRVKDPQYRSMLQQVLHKGAATRVAVLGGGNTAMDVSRSLRRLGVKDVRILYRRTRAEMPAMPEEIEDAEREGVTIEYLVAPVRVLGNEKTGVRGLECIRMKLGEPDASGRRRPVPIAGSEFVIKLDRVVLAIGQAPDLDFLGPEHQIAITRNERINVADVSFMTSRPGVFAVGDAVTTDKMVVIEAIGMGKQAAAAIDAYLKGELPQELVVDAREVPIARRVLAEADLTPIPRISVPIIPMEQRTNSFDEVELGYTAEQAVAEARRCLACGPCSECQACVQVCETGAIVHDQHETYHELDVGAIIYAGQQHNGWDVEPGIYHLSTQDTLSASAVSARVLGSIKERLALPVIPCPTQPDGVGRMGAFICNCGEQIAGLVDTEFVRRQVACLPDVVFTDVLPFACSLEAAGRIGQTIREHGLERIVLAACSCCSLEQVCFSCTYQRMRCKHNLQGLDCAAPVQFEFVNIREQCAWVHADDPHAATAKAVTLVTAAIAAARAEPIGWEDRREVERSALIVGSGLAASTCKSLLDRQGISAVRFRGLPEGIERAGGQYRATRGDRALSASALVLAPKDTGEMKRISSALDRDPGWETLETRLPGIFTCNPELDGELAGAAASARVAAWLGRLESHVPLAARVDPNRCRACSTCISICEFGAPSLKEIAKDRYASWIDPAICTGCGTCAAHCPSGAITTSYMNDVQLHAMLKAILSGEAVERHVPAAKVSS